jgi:hypothetical protein
MSRPWFDPKTHMLLLDDYVAESPSFKKVLEDGVVTDAELEEHAGRVIALLEELDRRLPEDLKDVAADALCELAVLYALYRARSEQEIFRPS